MDKSADDDERWQRARIGARSGNNCGERSDTAGEIARRLSAGDTTLNGLHRLKVTTFRPFAVNYQRGLIDS